MATENIKALTDCYWFLNGQCTKGEACEYRHSDGALHNPAVCKFWLQGQCTNENCIFRHPSVTAVQPKSRKETPCYYFAHGGCMKGENCPFSHDPSVLSSATPLSTEGSAVATQPPSQELLDKQKREQMRLKLLQEEIKKEEERLHQLKAQGEAMTTPSNKSQQGNKGRNTNPALGTFNKTVDQVKQQKQNEKGKEVPVKSSKQPNANTGNTSNTNKPQKSNQMQTTQSPASQQPAKGKNKTKDSPSVKASTSSPNLTAAGNAQKNQKAKDGNVVSSQKAAPLQKKQPTPPVKEGNFGVKTLDEILKERQQQGKGASETGNTTKPESTTSSPALKVETAPKTEPKKTVDLNEIRKRNEKKFQKTANASNPSAAPTTTTSTPASATPSIAPVSEQPKEATPTSPKRKQPSSDEQQKRRKLENTPSDTPSISSIDASVSSTTMTDQIDIDIDKDLEDFDLDVDIGESNLDLDFDIDKEAQELGI